MQDKPLQGLRVLVTRAEEQADSFATLLQEQGATTIERAFSKLDQALKERNQYDWIIFASHNAVKFTLQRLNALGLPPQALNCCQLASIGAATSSSLNEAGLTVAFQPTVYVAESLASELPQQTKLAGKRILWPKTNIGRLLIAEELEAAGAKVDIAIAYESGLPANKEQLGLELVGLLKDKAIDVITLASAQTARNLGLAIELGLQLHPEAELMSQGAQTAPAMADHKKKLALAKEDLLASVKIAAIGPITASAAEQSLGRVDLVAKDHTLKGLATLLASLKFEQNHL
jgi:uroporphyrinogen III methyltransferase / synthase